MWKKSPKMEKKTDFFNFFQKFEFSLFVKITTSYFIWMRRKCLYVCNRHFYVSKKNLIYKSRPNELRTPLNFNK